jgi:hypothetical protein
MLLFLVLVQEKFMRIVCQHHRKGNGRRINPKEHSYVKRPHGKAIEQACRHPNDSVTRYALHQLGSLDSIELSVSRAADGDIAGEAGQDGGIARVEIGKITVGDDGNNMDVADGDVTKLKEYIARNYEIGEEKVIIK